MNRQDKQKVIIEFATAMNFDIPEIAKKLDSKEENLIDLIYVSINNKRFVEMILSDRKAFETMINQDPKILKFNGNIEELGDQIAKVISESVEKIMSGGLKTSKYKQHFEAELEALKNVTPFDKVMEIMKIGNTLQTKIDNSTLFTRAHDLSIDNCNWLDQVIGTFRVLMKDDHYKTCGCVAAKFEPVLFSDTWTEAEVKLSATFNTF